MKQLFIILNFVLTISFAFGQFTAPKEYFDLVKKADSYYAAKDYKNSAKTYSLAFKSFGWKGFINNRYCAACSWALAGNLDSAFYMLEKIVFKANYSNFQQISSDKALVTLYDDSRWLKLLDQVTKNKEKAELGLNKPLLYLLDSLAKEDQKWRNYLSKFENKELKRDPISKETILENIKYTDDLNYIEMKKIYKKFGFPNYDLVGPDGSHNFWLLVQHQDAHPKFQDTVLNTMKKEVDKGKASVTDYAYLVDRVKINSGKLQIYGTQMVLNSTQSSYEPLPVIEPENLNERRKTVGLGSIEAYIETMNTNYFEKSKK